VYTSAYIFEDWNCAYRLWFTYRHICTRTRTYIPWIHKVSQRQYDVEKVINKLIYKFQCTILQTFHKNIISHLYTQKINLQSKRSVYVGLFVIFMVRKSY